MKCMSTLIKLARLSCETHLDSEVGGSEVGVKEVIGIAIVPIPTVSPPKRGPNDIAIFPLRDWSV